MSKITKFVECEHSQRPIQILIGNEEVRICYSCAEDLIEAIQLVIHQDPVEMQRQAERED